MAFDLRSKRRNLYPATALTAGTVTTQTETAKVGIGLRLYITCSAVTTGGGNDSVNICAIAPNGTTVALLQISQTNYLAQARTGVIDLHPGVSGNLLGSGITVTPFGYYAAISFTLPLQWCIQLTLGTGNAATLQVDAEILP